MWKTEERNQKILEDYRAGKTLRQLAAEHNLTWQRISQLLHRLGEFSGESRRGKSTGKMQEAQAKREAKEAKRAARHKAQSEKMLRVSEIWKSGKSPAEMAEALGVTQISYIYTYAYRYRQRYPDLFPLRQELEVGNAA